jgi:serine/threonine-protein kinase
MIEDTRGEDSRLAELLLRWEELHDLGRSVAAEELCDDCPELAAELARRIALLCGIAPVLNDSTVGAAARGKPPPVMTDESSRGTATARAEYRDLRFHASGALGEVFLARNAELNREVALKFLSPNRTGDPDSLRRFLREAEVTGRLEHPGVVPVYTLGADAAGTPCYAMRFIQGQTLQSAIDSFHIAARTGHDLLERSMALRELLTRFVSVCTTVAYAHSRGILHRDLKPRNIMLGRFDETLVVDWGLAKPFVRDDSATGVGDEMLTPSSGSGGSGSETPTVGVVGTLAYMSPEQAEARWDLVGPASDIFSLGAILYSVLTGRSPYRADSHGEIVQRVRRCQFPRPREVKPEVPGALEAICLRAMAAMPADRYASALELAADVKYWLADEPVKAWREPATIRARRWAQRHRTVLTSAAAVLLLSVVGLGQFAGVLARKNRELVRQRARVEEREMLAVDAVRKFRDAVAANPELKNRSEMDALRKALLKQPMEFFGKLRDQLQAEPDTSGDVLARLAAANFDLAGTTRELGSMSDALRSYSEALAIRERLDRENPTNERYQSDLAQSHNALGNMYTNTGRQAEATQSFEQAIAIFERVASDHPGVPEHQRDLASAHGDLAIHQYNTGQPALALESHRRALVIFERLASEYPSVAEYQRDLALSHNNIGSVLNETGRTADAADSFRRSLAIRERLAHENPTSHENKRDLAMSYYNLGCLHRDTGQPEEALRSYREALAIREPLARGNPSDWSYQSDLARCYADIGVVLIATDQATLGAKSCRQAAEIFGRLARENPSVTFFQMALAATLNNLAEVEMGQGRWPEARQLLDEAIEHGRKALAAVPRDSFVQLVFRSLLFNLAKAHWALQQPDQAIKAARELAVQARGSPTDLYNVACALALGVPLTRGQEQHALAAEAVLALKEAASAGWNDAAKAVCDSDLAPLRDRDDFCRLLVELFDRGFPANVFAP